MSGKTTETQLLARLGALPREIQPANDVWADVESRIVNGKSARDESRPTSRWWYHAAAASFVLLLAAGILLDRQWSEDPTPTQAGITSGVQGDQVLAGALSGTRAATELEYHAAFQEFIPVGDPSGTLELNTIETLIASWNDLRKTEAGLNSALQQNPDNPFLNEKMLKLRARQLDFLKRIAALERSSRRTMI